MKPETQAMLLDIPEQPVPTPLAPPSPEDEPSRGRAKLKPIDRSQGFFRPVVVDELVGPDHKVRAIWDLTGELDPSGFLDKVKSQEGKKGRAAWNPRLLLSVWLYAYSEQVTSAREIERLMEYEPGLMWLAGAGRGEPSHAIGFSGRERRDVKEVAGRSVRGAV